MRTSTPFRRQKERIENGDGELGIALHIFFCLLYFLYFFIFVFKSALILGDTCLSVHSFSSSAHLERRQRRVKKKNPSAIEARACCTVGRRASENVPNVLVGPIERKRR